MRQNLHDIHGRAVVARREELKKYLADLNWLPHAMDEETHHEVPDYVYAYNIA
jgi:hypothetical protein